MMQDERDRFEVKFFNYCKKKLLISPKTPILIAVSGGKDSMCLLHLFQRFSWKIAVAHCNFMLRNEDSEKDEQFVKTYCNENNIPMYSIRFDTKQIAESKKQSIQETARILRYNWFEDLRIKHHFEYIATAHHANDSAETVIYNIIKGTGIKGLHGIKSKSNHIIRPLISFENNEILTYIHQNNIQYREDKSNAETKYARNFIRHEVLPLFNKININAVSTIAEKAIDWNDSNALFEELIQAKTKKVLLQQHNYKYISIAALNSSKAPETLLYYILQPFGFNATQIKDIYTISNENTHSGKMISSNTHIVFRDRKSLLLSDKNKATWNEILIEKKNSSLDFEFASITIQFAEKEYISQKQYNNTSEFVFDADSLTFPLLLRHWRMGDYMYIDNGKKHKKKLSDIFINQKWNLIQKKEAMVLCSGEKIIAVLGLHIDARFKPSPNSKNILKLHFKQK